ncbi:SPOR domain-containing protein [Vulcaniibacterium gelatinicum]|uniref:SPOR domain-containing protein n=1 Tax=Vulcaniibacterium gelatinicum TaxID=2598725 RepID=UPI0011C9FD37|nr:SPOR domain-containing protein [Vulcaniibacterium gelatinicum]
MAARRGRSQARRTSGDGIPGWAWLIAGILIGIVALIAAPKFLRSDAADGFFRPTPNPDAKPAADSAAPEAEPIVPEPAEPAKDAPRKEPTYDFYTLLPGEEVALSDAELAARERAEAEREAARQDAATPAAADADVAAANAAPPAAAEAPTERQARYLLQAGAFAASGDAEALKARIALLGLSARVESAQRDGKTLYRVRMGPYGTAAELAEAKRKLADGGLPAMAIKVK